MSTFASVDDLLAEPADTTNWVVDQMLPVGGLSLIVAKIVAKPKIGKSTLGGYLGHCVAYGLPFLGRVTTSGPVLYVTVEERRADVQAHFARLLRSMPEGTGKRAALHVHVGPVPDDPPGSRPADPALWLDRLAWLTAAITRFRPALVIIDTWGRFSAVKDINDYVECTAATTSVIALATESGAHIVFETSIPTR